MSDKDTTPEVKETDVEQGGDQGQRASVDPARAAAEAAAKEYKSTPSPEAGFTKEQREEINKLIESASSKAVNDYRAKAQAELEEKRKAGEYLTREDLNAALAQERERSRIAVEAERRFINEAAKLGVMVGTEEYEKLSAHIESKLQSGAVTPKALLDPDMIAALARSSGVVSEPKSQERKEEFVDLTLNARFDGMKEEDIPDFARADLDANKAVNEALRKQGMMR